MSAICFAGGVASASAVTSRMLDRLPASERSVAPIAPNFALAGNWHRPTPGGRCPREVRPGLWIAIDGEIFSESGIIRDPHSVFGDIHDRADDAGYAQLNGSFAAIIFDADAEAVTLIADRFATRPLYYWNEGKQVCVASRLLMMLADGRVPRVASRRGLIELFTRQRTFADRTIYEGVRTLPNGHVVRVTKEGAKVSQPSRLQWRGDARDPRATTEALADALLRAVKRRTVDVPNPMLLLSGGLDSRIVLAAARAPSANMSCVTICPWRSPEARVAETVARSAGSNFEYIESRPDEFADVLDSAVDWTDGMFPAPLSMFQCYPTLASRYGVAFTGHSLDIMFRATYQPKRSFRLVRSSVSLPMHRPVRDGSAATLAIEHHIHTEHGALAEAVDPSERKAWREADIAGIRAALATVEFSDPYDAFHAFCFHAQGRHHSNADYIGLAPSLEYRVIAFDRDVAEIYLGMPSAWRVHGKIAYAAMRRLSPELFRLPDANTGLRGDLGPWSRIVLGTCRAAWRRLRPADHDPPPSPWFTAGSWVDWSQYFRADAGMRAAIEHLKRDQALLDTGLFSRQGLSQAIDSHMQGKATYHKFLATAVACSSWFRRHGFTSVV